MSTAFAQRTFSEEKKFARGFVIFGSYGKQVQTAGCGKKWSTAFLLPGLQQRWDCDPLMRSDRYFSRERKLK